jgi:hypothetical protein
MQRSSSFSLSSLSSFLLLALVLALAGAACVAEPSAPSSEESTTASAQAIAGDDDWEKHNTLTESGPTTMVTCSSNADCGYGNRCWYGTCISGNTYCSSNCDCGYGLACGVLNGVSRCLSDFGPFPFCHCDANCASGVCNSGICASGGGGGGGGGIEQPQGTAPGCAPSQKQ